MNNGYEMKFKTNGFTLIEMLITVVIVGILAAIALPSYQNSVIKSNRSDGQAMLLETASLMERYFYDNNSYTTDLTNLGYTASSAVDSTEGHYKLSVATPTTACPIASCFKLTAAPQNNQSKDGNLTLNSLGVKEPIDKW